MDRKSILIVDDDNSVCESLVDLLKSDMVETRTAASLETAETLLKAEKFDLAIVDLRLKGSEDTEGLEVISLIKALMPDTRVVLFTGHCTLEMERAARARGARDCWEKDIGIATLIERFKALGIPAGMQAG